MDKRIEGFHKSLNQKIDTMQSSISGLNNQPQVLEKGRFPSQTLPNPRGVHELSFPSEPAQKMDEVQAIITLRSGKEIEQPMSKPVGKIRENEEEESEHIIINEDSTKKSMPPPPPPPPPSAVATTNLITCGASYREFEQGGGEFVEELKTINAQINQRIEKVESSMDKRIEGFHKSLNQKLDTMQSSISGLNNQPQVLEKGRFPSQTLPNPRGVHELSFPSEPAQKMDEVQAIITLRSGKEIEQPMSKPVGKIRENEEEESEHIIINEDLTKKSMPPPPPPPPTSSFPQALRGKKKASKQEGILEVLRQVKVNIPLLDMIKQVPTYAKFLKDLCIVKKGLGINKKAFLTEQVSSIIQCKTLLKYKDPGSPTISVNIGGTRIDKALLDLGASVNLLPYSVYKKLGSWEWRPTNITLSLADRSGKIPKGIVEDVLVKVDNFSYPVDFVVLDTKPMEESTHQVPIILGRPFLATANAIVNCWNGVMQLTFGNMTLELNIFHLSNRDKPAEDKEKK